jgi:hypothetical protein
MHVRGSALVTHCMYCSLAPPAGEGGPVRCGGPFGGYATETDFYRAMFRYVYACLNVQCTVSSPLLTFVGFYRAMFRYACFVYADCALPLHTHPPGAALTLSGRLSYPSTHVAPPPPKDAQQPCCAHPLSPVWACRCVCQAACAVPANPRRTTRNNPFVLIVSGLLAIPAISALVSITNG